MDRKLEDNTAIRIEKAIRCPHCGKAILLNDIARAPLPMKEGEKAAGTSFNTSTVTKPAPSSIKMIKGLPASEYHRKYRNSYRKNKQRFKRQLPEKYGLGKITSGTGTGTGSND